MSVFKTIYKGIRILGRVCGSNSCEIDVWTQVDKHVERSRNG